MVVCACFCGVDTKRDSWDIAKYINVERFKVIYPAKLTNRKWKIFRFGTHEHLHIYFYILKAERRKVPVQNALKSYTSRLLDIRLFALQSVRDTICNGKWKILQFWNM